MKKNKLFAGILISGLIATASVGLSGCKGNSNTTDFSSMTDVYGFAGMTTSLLATNQDVSTVMTSTNSLSANTALDDIKTKIQDAISTSMDKYMSVFDSVVGDKQLVDVKEITSDNSLYDHKLTIKIDTLDGTENTCEMYFNEILKSNGDNVYDIDDEEHETLLEGEMYFNGSVTPLYLKGEKEIDLEDNEMEVTFKAMYNKNDESNMIVFSQEKEKENGKIEEEYFFQIVVGGVTVNEFSFDIEKNNKAEIELEYEQIIAGQTISFEIEKTQNKLTLETKDFFGQELKIEVSLVKDEVANTEHYLYSIPSLQLTFAGADRVV